jgi:hypothetical protein
VTERDGKVLLHCHGGCSQEAVITALRDLGLWPERSRRWLSDAEFKTECRRQDQRRERERQAAYFCLALEPLLLEAIEGLPAVEEIEWDQNDPDRLTLTRELAMVRLARGNPSLQAALYIEWLEHAHKLAEAIWAAGVERHKRIQARIWGWISAQR